MSARRLAKTKATTSQPLEAASIAPLSYMFAGSTVDAEGRRVALKPPLSLTEREQDEAIFAHVVAHMSTQRLCSVHGAIFPAFDQLVSEHVITLQEIAGRAQSVCANRT